MARIKQNNAVSPASADALKRARKNMKNQAILTGLVVVLTIIIMFAITAAWYTNIVQTSGLVFEAAKWGFEGEVSVAEGVVEAAPGDEGVVSLTAVSDSDSVAAVSVNISKALIEDEEIHKRLFFYVDAQKRRNEETMDRVYLSSTENYTYMMFGRSALTLTEDVYNDARLKWHWVYDVLGYYVQGTWDGASMEISEYLRPIEYDYDEATTTFENGVGVLTTIDGVTTPEEYLYQISQNDGYAGTIGELDEMGDVVSPNVGGYYPVAVTEDETGVQSGVWAYLCSYTEIERNTEYDTMLGTGVTAEMLAEPESSGETEAAGEEPAEEAETSAVDPAQEPIETGETGGMESAAAVSAVVERPQYRVRITVSAQNTDVEKTEINTGSALLDQLSSAGSEQQVLQLVNNITLPNTLDLTGEQQVMIDLNGHTIFAASGLSTAVEVGEGSTLTLLNGVMEGNGGGELLHVVGGEVTLGGLEISNADRLITVEDNKGIRQMDSRVRIVNCTVDTLEETLYLRGNGSITEQMTQVIVENSSLKSGYIGIMGNGTDTGSGQWGTDVQIINSEVDGLWSGVYQPQRDSILTVSGNSLVTGYTGIAVKGGSVIVESGTVRGTGEKGTPSFGGSGYSDTGDGIYVESNYGYEIVVKVRSEGVLESSYGYGLQVYEPDAANVSVELTSANVQSIYGYSGSTGPEESIASDSDEPEIGDYVGELQESEETT